MSGKRRMVMNHLKSDEMYRLTRHVEDLDIGFESWDAAEGYFGKVLGRHVTQENIKTACKNCERDPSTIVAESSRVNGVALIWRELKAMRERIEMLEARNA